MLNRCGSALLLLGAWSAQALGGGCPPDLAQYRVTFDAVWSETTHPTDFPPNPHFSPLVGGIHNDQVSFWEVGGLATDGIELMAETGNATTLVAEVNAAIATGVATATLTGSGINSPGSTSIEFFLRQAHPLVTLVTMIAPSPDWFVGVRGLPLFQNGNWLDEVVVDLFPYDAGTDSATTYNHNDTDTNPAEPITAITGFPFLNNNTVGRLGTYTFDRLSETCTNTDTDTDGHTDDLDNCILVANVDQRDTDGDSIGNACDPDIAQPNDCAVNFLDLNAMKTAFFSQAGGPGWNPDADFNGDDSVNFADLGLMQTLFFTAPGPSASGCN